MPEDTWTSDGLRLVGYGCVCTLLCARVWGTSRSWASATSLARSISLAIAIWSLVVEKEWEKDVAVVKTGNDSSLVELFNNEK